MKYFIMLSRWKASQESNTFETNHTGHTHVPSKDLAKRPQSEIEYQTKLKLGKLFSKKRGLEGPMSIQKFKWKINLLNGIE